MTKKELVDKVAERTGFTKTDSEAAVTEIFNVISETLAKGESFPYIGFGTFNVIDKPEKTGRNPQNGNPITIPARKVVTFKVGKTLKEIVNK